jgi:hypothetical protein
MLAFDYRNQAGEEPEKNPFLRYLITAWVDVFDQNDNRDDPQFIGALRSLSAEG